MFKLCLFVGAVEGAADVGKAEKAEVGTPEKVEEDVPPFKLQSSGEKKNDEIKGKDEKEAEQKVDEKAGQKADEKDDEEAKNTEKDGKDAKDAKEAEQKEVKNAEKDGKDGKDAKEAEQKVDEEVKSTEKMEEMENAEKDGKDGKDAKDGKDGEMDDKDAKEGDDGAEKKAEEEQKEKRPTYVSEEKQYFVKTKNGGYVYGKPAIEKGEEIEEKEGTPLVITPEGKKPEDAKVEGELAILPPVTVTESDGSTTEASLTDDIVAIQDGEKIVYGKLIVKPMGEEVNYKKNPEVQIQLLEEDDGGEEGEDAEAKVVTGTLVTVEKKNEKPEDNLITAADDNKEGVKQGRLAYVLSASEDEIVPGIVVKDTPADKPVKVQTSYGPGVIVEGDLVEMKKMDTQEGKYTVNKEVTITDESGEEIKGNVVIDLKQAESGEPYSIESGAEVEIAPVDEPDTIVKGKIAAEKADEDEEEGEAKAAGSIRSESCALALALLALAMI